VLLLNLWYPATPFPQHLTKILPYLVFLVTVLWECFPYQGQIEIHHSSFVVSFSAYPEDQNAVCSKIYFQISLLDQMRNYPVSKWCCSIHNGNSPGGRTSLLHLAFPWGKLFSHRSDTTLSHPAQAGKLQFWNSIAVWLVSLAPACDQKAVLQWLILCYCHVVLSA